LRFVSFEKSYGYYDCCIPTKIFIAGELNGAEFGADTILYSSISDSFLNTVILKYFNDGLNLFLRFLDWFVPNKFLVGDSETLLRSRVIIGTGLLSFSVTAAYLLSNFLGSPWLLGLYWFCFGANVICVVGFRLGLNPKSAGFILGCSTAAAMISFAVVEGVFYSSTYMFFPVFVFVGIFFAGTGYGSLISLMMFAGMVFIHFTVLDRGLVLPEGWTFDNLSFVYFQDKVSSMVLAYALAMTYEHIRKKGVRELQQTQLQIIDQNSEMARLEKMAEMASVSAGVAHEVNNPLAIIQLNADFMASIAEEGTLSQMELATLAEKISKNCTRIARITSGLNDLYREEKFMPVFAIFDLRTLVLELAENRKGEFNRLSIDLQLGIPGGIVCIEGRRERIVALLNHLIKNSVDALKMSGPGSIEISLHRQPDSVELRVSDTGFGIPVEIENKVFAPFFSGNPVGNNVGLGLAIVKEIVQDHSGEIKIKRKEGKMTSISVFFPNPNIRSEAA